MRVIDLIWLGTAEPPAWPHGAVHRCPDASPSGVAALVARTLADGAAEAWHFSDGTGGLPAGDVLRRALDGPFQVMHAGLLLGQGGRPGLLDFVRPVWTFNRDPDAARAALSWRVSLRACLVHTEVLRQLGGPCGDFATLDGAALELGHRWITAGVLVQHDPALLADPPPCAADPLPLEDELRFIRRRYGAMWVRWGALRAVASGYASPGGLLRARGAMAGGAAAGGTFRHDAAEVPAPADARVSVLIPTLDRPTYLDTVLRQLRTQTVRPHEIIVVDQSSAELRDTALAERFADLPLRVLYQDTPGQTSSRNWGIRESTGDWILLLDDDIEVENDLVERHLRTCARFGADVSCGVAHEVGAGELPAASRHVQASGVFPAGNTLVRRAALERSGLFDPAFERRQNEDGELGLRVYLAGAVMVLDPGISVLHHHAPRGGLRVHGARVVTRASSRSRLLHRNVPTASEIYLMRRHFTPRQQREAVWLRVVGTFRFGGGRLCRASKAVLGLLLLPDTLARVRRNAREAAALERAAVEIPTLGGRMEAVPPSDAGAAR